MISEALILALMVAAGARSETIGPDRVLVEGISIRAEERCEETRKGFLISGTGHGILFLNEVESAFAISPAEVSDITGRILQTGILNLQDVIENELYVSVEGGGLQKNLIMSLESCVFQIDVRLDDFRKSVRFEDVGVVPEWLRQEFHKVISRAEES